MKTTLLLFLLVMVHLEMCAQTRGNKSLVQYFTVGKFVGIPVSSETSVEVAFRNKFLAGVDVFSASDRRDLPADYVEGLCPFGDCTPKQEVTVISALFGRQFKQTEKRYLNIFAGVAMVHQSKPVFARYQSNSFLNLSSNYSTVYRVTNSVGFTVIGREQWKISRSIAFNLSAWANINRIRLVIAPNVGITFELFRKKLS